MRPARRTARQRSPQVRWAVGGLTLLAVAGLLYLATTAQNGLPWQSHYRIIADVPNADRLVSTDDVMIGGVQVGQVTNVSAVPSHPGRQAYVRVTLALDPAVGHLPVDTRTQILSSSVLGATYVQLTPGTSPQKLRNGGTLPIGDAHSTVQVTDLLDLFDRRTARDVRDLLGGLSTGLAGRGTALNATLGSVSQLLPPVAGVMGVLAAPSTRFAGFLRAYGGFVRALAPVASDFGGLVAGGARTFEALAEVRPAIGSTIERLPPAETAATEALSRLTPSLNGLARLAVDLRAGGEALPNTLGEMNSTLAAGVRPMQQLPTLATNLRATLFVVKEVSRRKATDGAVRKLSDVVAALGPTLQTLEPAQVYCDVVPGMFWDFADALTGLELGPNGPSVIPFAITNIGAKGELLQQGRPSPNVNIDYVPTENATECASGNEPANGVTQSFNTPPGNLGHRHPSTEPPAASYALAAKAGLLTPPAGWHP